MSLSGSVTNQTSPVAFTRCRRLILGCLDLRLGCLWGASCRSWTEDIGRRLIGADKLVLVEHLGPRAGAGEECLNVSDISPRCRRDLLSSFLLTSGGTDVLSRREQEAVLRKLSTDSLCFEFQSSPFREKWKRNLSVVLHGTLHVFVPAEIKALSGKHCDKSAGFAFLSLPQRGVREMKGHSGTEMSVRYSCGGILTRGRGCLTLS